MKLVWALRITLVHCSVSLLLNVHTIILLSQLELINCVVSSLNSKQVTIFEWPKNFWTHSNVKLSQILIEPSKEPLTNRPLFGRVFRHDTRLLCASNVFAHSLLDKFQTLILPFHELPLIIIFLYFFFVDEENNFRDPNKKMGKIVNHKRYNL